MAEDDKKNQEQQLQIELTEEVAEGVYSNLAIINHSPSEFVIDFVKIMPGTPKAKVKSRVLVTPQHAKKLLRALNDNINKFESLHGEIKELDDQKQNAIPLNFGGPTGQA